MRLEINCQDRVGITQDILDILVEHEIDLRGIEIDETGKIFLNIPNMEFSDFQHLMPKIRKIEGIDDVKTTAFMPIEREQYQLQTLLKTLPDPVFSVDTKGKIILVNDAVLNSLGQSTESIIGEDICELLKGFNLLRWLESKKPLAQAQKIRFLDQSYLVDMLPVMVPDIGGVSILAGAVFMLKSEIRLGQQLTVFHQASADSVVSNEFEGSLDEELKRFEKDILMRLYPSFPSSRQLATKLGLSHTAVANKLRDYGINKKTVKIM